jgi:hypothetical protein
MPHPDQQGARQLGLEAELAALDAMTGPALRESWTVLTGGPVPRISPKLLRLALAWELQAAALGGLPRRTRQRLDQLAAARTRTAEARPGMRLMREWNGKLHVVTVGEDQIIRWNDKEWRSLSEVARAITGTRWSGPAFFGLKTKAKAA